MSALSLFSTGNLLYTSLFSGSALLVSLLLLYTLREQLTRKFHLILLSVFAWGASETVYKLFHVFYLLVIQRNTLIEAYKNYMILTFIEFIFASMIAQYAIVLTLKKVFKSYLLTWSELLSFALPWIVLQEIHLYYMYNLSSYPTQIRIIVLVVFLLSGLVMIQYISAQIFSTRFELYSAILRSFWEISIFSASTRHFILYDTYLLRMLGIAIFFMGLLLYIIHPVSKYKEKFKERYPNASLPA